MLTTDQFTDILHIIQTRGMKDDIIIVLQLGIFFTKWDAEHGLTVHGECGDLQAWHGVH